MSVDPIDSDVDRAKQELKKRYKPEDYEALIEFAAKYFISDSRRRIEMDNFHQAMLNMEFAIANKDEEDLQRSIKEAYQENTLFKDVMRLISLTGTFKAWNMNRNLHADDKEAKQLVISWWAEDKKNGCDKTDKIAAYQTKLGNLKLYPKCNTKSKTEKLEEDEEKNYTYDAISRWLSNK